MNRRKFIGNLLKGSAGVVATAFVGDKIIDALTPNEAPKFLRADGRWVAPIVESKYVVGSDAILGVKGGETGYVYAPYIPTVNLKLNEVTVQPKVVKLKNYRYAL